MTFLKPLVNYDAMFYFCAIKLIVTYGCKVNTMFRQ